MIFIEARTGSGDWGAPTAVFVTVPPPALTATLESGQIVLRWPSVSNASYTLLQSLDLSAPFGVLAGNIIAQPPTNTWSEPLNPAAARLYRLQIQP